MKVDIICEMNESVSNIGLAKALIEDVNLTPNEAMEVAEYLMIYSRYNVGYNHVVKRACEEE